MNFKIFKRLMALPLSSTERAVTTAICFHVQKDGDTSFPSYDTISDESGASNKTISKVIRTMRHIGVLEWRNRADISTGKKSNEYRFIFDGIKFTRDKLSKADRRKIKTELKKSRTYAQKEMADKKNGQNITRDTVTNVTSRKSQNVNNDVRENTSSEGYTIPSQMLLKPSQMLRRSSIDSVPNSTNYQESNTVVIPSKSQKRVSQKENHYSTTHKKRPQDQSNDEWLADMESSR